MSSGGSPAKRHGAAGERLFDAWQHSFLWSALQVSGVGYNGEGTVCLLPSKEVIKEFSNVSVGKLVEVSGQSATVEINVHLTPSCWRSALRPSG